MIELQGLKDWLEACPVFGGKTLYVDALPERPGEYAIEIDPENIEDKLFMRGAKKRILFLIASREIKLEDADNNRENLDFYAEVSEWMAKQNRLRRFPDIGAGQQVLQVLPNTDGYLAVADGHGTARYQMQCRLTYFQKG